VAEGRTETLKSDIDVTRRRISDALQTLERRAAAVVAPDGDAATRQPATRPTTLAFEAGAALSAAYSAYRTVRAVRSHDLWRLALMAAATYGLGRLAAASRATPRVTHRTPS
jgi:hypothetical protein